MKKKPKRPQKYIESIHIRQHKLSKLHPIVETFDENRPIPTPNHVLLSQLEYLTGKEQQSTKLYEVKAFDVELTKVTLPEWCPSFRDFREIN